MGEFYVVGELGLHLEDAALGAVFALDFELAGAGGEDDDEVVVAEVKVFDARAAELGGGEGGDLGGEDDGWAGDHAWEIMLGGSLLVANSRNLR